MTRNPSDFLAERTGLEAVCESGNSESTPDFAENAQPNSTQNESDGAKGHTRCAPTRKAYIKRYQRQWMADRRAAFFKDKACVLCGATERLELDHIDPAEKTTHNVWSWSKKRREAEIAKCQVLCRECHLEKTKAFLSERQRGEKSPYAKLTDAKVAEARRLRKAGWPIKRLMSRYGVSMTTMCKAVSGESWQHVEEPPVPRWSKVVQPCT